MEAPSQSADAWGIYPQLTADVFQQAREGGVEAMHAQLLSNRGLKTVEEMRAFVQADYAKTRNPLDLIDMPEAVERIQRALASKEHMTVYGDYDADGVTSSSLLFRALRKLKHPDALLDFHIPHRLKDGCGLNNAALDALKARGTSLIITTDCASSDVAQVNYAKMLGIDVIITDHHHPPQELPGAYAMVNPWRPDCAYGERYLCGVGIAFKLVQALYRAYKRSQEEEMELLDLVAIGTIADIAPLQGENHTLVQLGMQRLNTTNKPGLKALIKILDDKNKKYKTYSTTNVQARTVLRERDIAFGLAPLINAAGRMKEASLAFELMITDDERQAVKLAGELEQLNTQRQQQTEELMQQARQEAQQQTGKAVILVHGNHWHEGIIGLVAGKLVEEINKPVLVLSNDPETQLSRGSARSLKDFNIIEALRGYTGQLERYGGHAQAAGFTIRTTDIEQLHQHLLYWKEHGGLAQPAVIPGTELPDQTGVVTEQENSEENITAPTPKMIDLIFTRLELLNYEQYKLLRQLSPFGAGNPEPTFKMERIRLLESWISGATKQNLTLKMAGGQGSSQQKGTYLKGAIEQPKLAKASHIDVVFQLQASDDDAKTEVWLKILAVEPVE